MKKNLNCLIVMPQVVRKMGDPYRFPIGICYISSMLKSEGYSVITLNVNHERDNIEDLLERYITQYNIDVLLTGGLIIHYSKIKNIIDAAKLIRPQIINIIGGGVVTGRPEVVMRGLQNADFGIVNEGEYSVCELLEALEGKTNFEDIKGILYRKNGTIVQNENREDIANLDKIPYPDYEGFGMNYYLGKGLGAYSSSVPTRTFGIITSRSCPYKCTFCFHSCGNTYRQRSLENVFGEIEYLIEKYRVEYFNIYDELFAVDEERVRDFCNKMKKYNIPWECSMRVDRVTEPMLELLKDGGCAMVGFGIESMDLSVLKSMQKFITPEMVNKAIQLAEKVGIACGGNLIFGDLNETLETAYTSLAWYEQNQYAQVTLALIAVYPGTHLYEQALIKGIISDELQYIESGCLNINISQMTDLEYGELLQKINATREQDSLPPNFMKVITIDKFNKQMELEVCCPNCGEVFIYPNADLLLMKMKQICPGCQNKYQIESIRCFYELVEKVFEPYREKKYVYGGNWTFWMLC